MDRAVLVACMHQTKKNILIDAIATDFTYTFDDFLILIPMHLNPYCLFLANEDDGKKSLNIIFPPLKWTSKQASAQPIHFVNVGPISRLSIECVCLFCLWIVNEAIKQNYAIAQSSSYQNEEKILQIFIQPIHLNQSQV